MKRKQKFSLTLIHETNVLEQHRIVAIASDGTNSFGDWAEKHKLATHLDTLANSDPDNGLPLGIFKTRDVPHQVLIA